jgi:hypothetical protein
VQGFIDLRQWTRGRVAPDFSSGTHGQYRHEILSRADGRSLDAHLQRGHLDSWKA